MTILFELEVIIGSNQVKQTSNDAAGNLLKLMFYFGQVNSLVPGLLLFDDALIFSMKPLSYILTDS